MESTGEAGKASRYEKVQNILKDHRTVVFSSELLYPERSEMTLKGLKALGLEFFSVNVDEDLDVRVGIQVRVTSEGSLRKEETFQEHTGNHNFPQVLMVFEDDSEILETLKGLDDKTDKNW